MIRPVEVTEVTRTNVSDEVEHLEVDVLKSRIIFSQMASYY